MVAFSSTRSLSAGTEASALRTSKLKTFSMECFSEPCSDFHPTQELWCAEPFDRSTTSDWWFKPFQYRLLFWSFLSNWIKLIPNRMEHKKCFKPTITKPDTDVNPTPQSGRWEIVASDGVSPDSCRWRTKTPIGGLKKTQRLWHWLIDSFYSTNKILSVWDTENVRSRRTSFFVTHNFAFTKTNKENNCELTCKRRFLCQDEKKSPQQLW